jgi:TatD DNase family protein
MSNSLNQDSCPYPYVDLHSHLQFEDFDADREEVLRQMKDNNVITINVGTTLETSIAGLQLAETYPLSCYATVGLHPVYAEEASLAEKFADVVRLSQDNPRIAGIGECGMDFFRTKDIQKSSDLATNISQNETIPVESTYEIQEKVFEGQIQLAKQYNLPLMLHVRDSYQKTLTILLKYFNPTQIEYRGNAHFFVGSIQEAQAFLDLGFSISFTGVITFVPAYEELVRFVPLDRMFAETDSPYVSPAPYRGKRNTPVHVIEIYKKIAEIKQVPLEVVRETLYKNACKYWLKDRNIDNSVL